MPAEVALLRLEPLGHLAGHRQRGAGRVARGGRGDRGRRAGLGDGNRRGWRALVHRRGLRRRLLLPPSWPGSWRRARRARPGPRSAWRHRSTRRPSPWPLPPATAPRSSRCASSSRHPARPGGQDRVTAGHRGAPGPAATAGSNPGAGLVDKANAATTASASTTAPRRASRRIRTHRRSRSGRRDTAPPARLPVLARPVRVAFRLGRGQAYSGPAGRGPGPGPGLPLARVVGLDRISGLGRVGGLGRVSGLSGVRGLRGVCAGSAGGASTTSHSPRIAIPAHGRAQVTGVHGLTTGSRAGRRQRSLRAASATAPTAAGQSPTPDSSGPVGHGADRLRGRSRTRAAAGRSAKARPSRNRGIPGPADRCTATAVSRAPAADVFPTRRCGRLARPAAPATPVAGHAGRVPRLRPPLGASPTAPSSWLRSGFGRGPRAAPVARHVPWRALLGPAAATAGVTVAMLALPLIAWGLTFVIVIGEILGGKARDAGAARGLAQRATPPPRTVSGSPSAPKS